MSKSWQVYARHVLDAAAKIARIQSRGQLVNDEILYDATLRNLQTLSEATQMLPDRLKSKFPGIPWREIAGFRNILVHNYLGDIDAQTIQNVVEQHLPALVQCMQALLDQADPATD